MKEQHDTAQAADLHPKTADLVQRFAAALADKLAAAEKKYGYSDGWMAADWMGECRLKLREHLLKGDPRDVAAYCAFLWHHDESTALPIEEFEQLFQTNKPDAAQADSVPAVEHVGESQFESWYSAYNPAHKSDKQRARDAYAEGMTDSARAPADSVTAPAGEVVGYRISDPGEPDLGHWLSEEPGAAWCVSEPLTLATHTQPAHATKAGNQQEARPCHVFTVRKAGGLTEWEPTSMAFALPDGAHALYTLPQPTPPAQTADSVLEDAARYRFLAGHCRSTSEHWGGRWSIVVDGPAPKSHDSEDDFDEAVDAARKQGANHD